MGFTVTQESFDRLTSYWQDSSHHLKWGSVFVLPAWLKGWWQAFQPEAELYLSVVRQKSEVIGIAPLRVKDGRASFIGGVDVCDYLDFVVAPGKERDFFRVLLDDLRQKSINHLDLHSLRPDATVLTDLIPLAENRQHKILRQKEAVSLELDLPATWEEYLAMLNGKQRHEVRRKLRRLGRAGKVDYRCVAVSPEEVGQFMDSFLRLFVLSREKKANFMTPQMESFFRSLAGAMAEIGLLRFGSLELDTKPVAMVLGFDYNGVMYLYNSAYDPEYNSLSVGLLSKVLSIRECIERGLKKWDFLKGAEEYKYQLGGQEIPLYHCQIFLK